jgi:hypothetical protein
VFGKGSSPGERPMSDEELILRFETGAISPSGFHHADHVRLAFAYLRTYPLLTALEKFSSALQRFAASVGKPHRYNQTITFAYLFLMHERMIRASFLQWEDFARDHGDLLTWKEGILNRYYRPETLNSDLAREAFIFPDKNL